MEFLFDLLSLGLLYKFCFSEFILQEFSSLDDMAFYKGLFASTLPETVKPKEKRKGL